MLEFALFGILGWKAFGNPQGNTNIVLLVLFAVLMLLWLLGVVGVAPLAAWHLR